jgi:hypothetical protein
VFATIATVVHFLPRLDLLRDSIVIIGQHTNAKRVVLG